MVNIHPQIAQMRTESAFGLGDKILQAKQQGVDVINLGLGQPEFLTPEHIVEAGIKALQDGKHGYTHPLGIIELREAVAQYYQQRYGADVHPDEVIITPGGKPTMNNAIALLASPGTEVIYPDPGFPIYGSMISYMGAKEVPLPLREDNDFKINIDDIRQRITDKTSLLIINSPHNPTGAVTSGDALQELATLLEDYPNCVLLSDEIYSHFTFGETQHTSMLQFPALRERLIILDGFSKTFAMTGWRLGFSVWPKKLIPYIFRMAVNHYSCPNVHAQYAGIAAISGSMEAVENMCRHFASNAEMMWQGLNQAKGISCVKPEGAFYIFPNISGTGLDSEQFAERLLFETGVAGLAGIGFGATGANHLRLSCVSADEPTKKALQRIQDFCASI